MTITSTDTGPLLHSVLHDLERVVGAIDPDRFDEPTPCPDFTVADLRRHVLGWLTFFGAAVTDPAGRTERPDPTTAVAPDTAVAAATQVDTAAARIAAAIENGVSDGDVVLTQDAMPGGAALDLILWEYLVHGWDLAAATGQGWTPPDAACERSYGFAQQMLTPEWRGTEFGEPVPVADDASPLDRLLGFTGRDPAWPARSPGQAQ